MAGPNTPISFPVTASLNTPVSAPALTIPAHEIIIFNRSTGEVFITIDGATPTVAGVNQYYIPAVTGASLMIDVVQGEQSENNFVYPILQAISAAALSLWVVLH